LNDHGSLGEELAILEDDSRNVPFGVDGQVVFSASGLLGAIVHLHEFERMLGFSQSDVGDSEQAPGA